MRRSFALALLATLACESFGEGLDLDGDGPTFVEVISVDESTTELRFAGPLDVRSIAATRVRIVNATRVPPVDVEVLNIEANGDRRVMVESAPLESGATYTLHIAGLKDLRGREVLSSQNFVVRGRGVMLPIRFVPDDAARAAAVGAAVVMVTIDETGRWNEAFRPVLLNGMAAVVEIEADPARTVALDDNNDPRVDRRGYVALLADAQGRHVGAPVVFSLNHADANRTVVLPVDDFVGGGGDVDPIDPVDPVDPPVLALPPPPVDSAPDDGVRVVRVVIDDRFAQALASPALRVAADASGAFDASFPTTLPFERLDGEFAGVWSVEVNLAVDPNRIVSGTTQATFPYVAILVENGTPYESQTVALIAPNEVPTTESLPLGRPGWTPVTFRVDASQAYLSPDGSRRGVEATEAVFLTGEWQQAVDALGNNCGDGFSGGEQLMLQMRPVAGSAVVARTLWLPPGRPYGWKVVRCNALAGCGPLNRLVASSGRAFATVMKNLVTENRDAFAHADVGVVDPLNPASTTAGGQTFDYSNGTVHIGAGAGPEANPAGVPDGVRLFKQEVPDLIVVVGGAPLITPVIHVGTWRDINLPLSPAEIVATETPVQLGPYDYDDGFIGRYPPSRQEP